jgi:hypothetical protein
VQAFPTGRKRRAASTPSPRKRIGCSEALRLPSHLISLFSIRYRLIRAS